MWRTSSSEEEEEEREVARRTVHRIRRRRLFRVRTNFNFGSLFEFNERFRMTAVQMEFVLSRIGHRLEHATARNHALSPSQKLCLALHWLGTGSQYHAVSDMHGVSKASVCRAVHSTVMAVNTVLFHEVVAWPENITEVTRQFYTTAAMPNVVGCVDGTLVNIEKPHQFESNFVDRHGNHSLNCMVVSGPDCMFYYVNASWPGSVHDSRVLRNTNLYRRMQEGWRPNPNAVLLGDSGYPLLEWLITPASNNMENPAVRRFNRSHKSTRRIVENALGILKGKFPCLNHLRMQPSIAAEVFKCCTALCNIARPSTTEEIVMPEDQQTDDPDPENGDLPPPTTTALRRLNELINHFR